MKTGEEYTRKWASCGKIGNMLDVLCTKNKLLILLFPFCIASYLMWSRTSDIQIPYMAVNSDNVVRYAEESIVRNKLMKRNGLFQNNTTLSTKMLLPLLLNKLAYGSNVQYNTFLRAAVFAKEHNYSVVLIPFFDTGSNDRGYNARTMRPWGMTFDVDKFKEFVSVTTMDDFKNNYSP
ncbi:uncharacterized protein LOC144347223 [Saccoglossus kowalevskii]